MDNRLTYLIVGAYVIISFTLGYNLEERVPIYKKGPNGSTFGFSVALHKTTDKSKSPLKKNILVVGAPTADALSSQQSTHQPGGIFYCPLTEDVGDCKRVKMDKGESTRTNNKTGQWLGVSLKSQGPGKYLITCAHRHSSVTGFDVNENQRLCGKCFLLDNTGKGGLKEITVEDSQDVFIDSPCKRVDEAVRRYHNGISYAQSGTDIAFHGDKYLLGAPGAWSWTGAMFDFTLYDVAEDNWHAQLVQSFFQTAGCTTSEMNNKVERCTKIPVRRDSYMGFSVATSDHLIPGSNETVFLAGAPRGNFTGAVVLYHKETHSDLTDFLSPLSNDVIMGPQMGSSFGYSVMTSDVNGDGLDDIIIGAPQFYQYSDEGKFGGAVFVYLNTVGKLFSKVTPQRLFGPPDSFFGYSLAPLGDLDQDGYSDFAVGAPYEGSSGKVYIYRGQPDGKVKESQLLNGKNYKELGVGMTAFGISLNSNIDIDNNNYPDLLVGTLSDQVILFRTRPTISVDSSLVTTPDILDLSKPNCEHNGKKYSCFKLTFCLSYTSRRDEIIGELELEYKLTLDSKRQRKNRASRVYYGKPNGPTSSEGTAVIPDAGQLFCPIVNESIFFNPISRNKLQPITIDLKFWLVADNNVTSESTDQPISALIGDPILNADYANELIDIVTIKTDCGDDGCQSDLKVNGSFPPQVLIGGDRNLKLRLEISNDGEEAHQAYVTIKLPPQVYYDNFTIVTSSTGHAVKCYTSSKGDTTFLNCILGNPYPGGGAREVIDFNLDATDLTTATKQIVIEVSGSTSSTNPPLKPFFLYCDVIVEMALSLKSYGRPQQIRYSNRPIIGMSAINFTSEIGPWVEFTFNIKNEGFQPAEGVEFVVNFPYAIANGKWLFYLETARVIGGYGGYCEDKYVNELGLQLGGPPSGTEKQEKGAKNSAVRSAGHAEKLSSVRRLQCNTNSTQCADVICKLEPIQGGATVSVKLQSRLWKYTFLEEYVGVDLVMVETLAHVRNVDDNVRIKGNTKQKIETTVDSNIAFDDVTATFPWWYIVIAIAGALLIYVMVVLCLFRCGFFKRQRYKRKNDRGYVVYPEEDEKREHLVTEHSQI